MASVNKVIILGRLGADPEARETASGLMVGLRVATSRQYKDKDGNRQEETCWHRIVIFGRTAEIANQYLKKGSEVYIEGRLKTRKYTDKDGVEKFATDILCETMQLGSRPQSPAPESKAAAPARPASAPQRPMPNDDVPF